MNTNEQLIHDFYTSFKHRDYKGMQACYADQAVFNDAVFKNLNADEVKSMWEMLISKNDSMRIEFNGIIANGSTVKAHWDAYYTFSSTGNKVINRIDSIFEIEEGKIIKQTDDFNFYKWVKQALGISGLLLGWTGFLRNKVQTTARKSLDSFMLKKKN